ncbi:H+-transporting two-sector ATPase, gamma subunit [Paraburkholderia xenovorans LB400]|uniref:H+-transporting two-sector ATPase, gamma subunit n=2 Tax=Paraburkholderia xenovorans TaxID=36873 RepID=Q13IX0_PARXL|nr:H+-transporting two-sector ATPase, gamma subunit [Paraburkholderia xenovorans LB400]
MRGIAAARSREAQSRIEAIRACARTVGNAIGDALMFEQHDEPQAPPGHAAGNEVVIVLCAEQGFVGTFNEHVIEATARRVASRSTEFFLIGARGIAVAAEHGLTIGWSAPMVAHADEVPALADRITAALYERLNAGQATRVTLLHAVPNPSVTIEVVKTALWPFDFTRFKQALRANPPLITLTPEILLAKLAEEYIFAQLCEAIMLSFAAENEARMRAMVAARTNVHDTLDELIGESRRLRQDEITSEIVELSSVTLAAATPRRRRHGERKRGKPEPGDSGLS